MAILRCKMCGGSINIEDGSSVCQCEYCGSKQTVPTLDDDKKTKLFERANRLRFNCEFDKAASIYENIVSEYSEEAEGYWGLLLSKYGIEYVDDPTTGKKIPTCHRSSFDSFMDDEDFEMVMEYSDTLSKSIYREEAKYIENLRKSIIEVSGKEEPYDIFICYKETDDTGNRTLDSVMAQDVYDVLNNKGYKVFFSRISLEDKLGVEYEPYIFAALNSAKVMLVFGTTYDYFNAVWVKNEWSRFLKLMVTDKTKYLIPCFKNIDAYDIPKEFVKLQSQDMGKIGAVQDLIRGIEKLIRPKEIVSKQVSDDASVIINTSLSQVDNLVRRGYMAMEDGAWEKAKDFFESALNINVEEGRAYWGGLLSEYKCINGTALASKLIKELEKNNSVIEEYKRDFPFLNIISINELINILPEMKLKQKIAHIKAISNDGMNSFKFINNSLYSRAVQFATAEIKDDISQMNKIYNEAFNKEIRLLVQEGNMESFMAHCSKIENILHLTNATYDIIKLGNECKYNSDCAIWENEYAEYRIAHQNWVNDEPIRRMDEYKWSQQMYEYNQKKEAFEQNIKSLMNEKDLLMQGPDSNTRRTQSRISSIFSGIDYLQFQINNLVCPEKPYSLCIHEPILSKKPKKEDYEVKTKEEIMKILKDSLDEIKEERTAIFEKFEIVEE